MLFSHNPGMKIVGRAADFCGTKEKREENEGVISMGKKAKSFFFSGSHFLFLFFFSHDFHRKGRKMDLIVNKNVKLKEVEMEDAPSLYALIHANRGHLRRFLGWIDATEGTADIEMFIAGSRQRRMMQNGTDYGLWYKGRIVGVVGLHYMDWINHCTSIGYWIIENMQGKGIMTAAVSRLIRYVFDELGLNRVEIRCAVENEKSRAIPERLGFTREGQIRQGEWLYDHYVDHIVYGLLKNEWRRA
jgi:ribosomal-protein-serine acetyltransferase